MTGRGATRRAVRACLALTVVAVLATGCGEDDDPASSPSGTSSSGDPTQTVQPSTRPPAQHPNGMRTSPSTSVPSSPSVPASPPRGPRTGAPSSDPPAGTVIAGESIDQGQADELQQAVDEGHQPWRTDVAAVAAAFARGPLGWTDVQVALADPHTAELTRPSDGRMVSLQLRQPAREGEGGVWVVTGGVWLT